MKYEILIGGQRPNLSVLFPDPSIRGICVATNSVGDDEDITAKLAQPTDAVILGHLARDITAAGGPTLEDQVFGNRLEAPDKAGKDTTVEDVEMYAVEGDDHLSATNPLAAKNDFVTFVDGKASKAQSGEYAHYQVMDVIAAQIEGNDARFVLKRIGTFKLA